MVPVTVPKSLFRQGLTDGREAWSFLFEEETKDDETKNTYVCVTECTVCDMDDKECEQKLSPEDEIEVLEEKGGRVRFTKDFDDCKGFKGWAQLTSTVRAEPPDLES